MIPASRYRELMLILNYLSRTPCDASRSVEARIMLEMTFALACDPLGSGTESPQISVLVRFLEYLCRYCVHLDVNYLHEGESRGRTAGIIRRNSRQSEWNRHLSRVPGL